MAIKYTNIHFNIYFKTLQNLPENWDFWFENIPSGNPSGIVSSWEFKGREIESRRGVGW
jgi:hypothetical protein